jgi:hypothetical protein
MRMGRIESNLEWSDFVIVRMLRRWAAVRSLGEKALPSLVALARELGEEPQVAISLHSLFQLTEACLCRALEPECCCSSVLSSDEQAVLALIAAAPATGLGSSALPHGLPGTLAWAAATARLMLGRLAVEPASLVKCPFDRARAD